MTTTCGVFIYNFFVGDEIGDVRVEVVAKRWVVKMVVEEVGKEGDRQKVDIIIIPLG